MKLLKRTTLLAAALLAVGGNAWAEDISVDLSTGTYLKASAENANTNIGNWRNDGTATLTFTVSTPSKYALMFDASSNNTTSKIQAQIFNSSETEVDNQNFDIVYTGGWNYYYNTYSMLTPELAAGTYTVKFTGTITSGDYVCNMKDVKLRPEDDFFATDETVDLSKASYGGAKLEGSSPDYNYGSINAKSNAVFNVKVTAAKAYQVYFKASNKNVAGSQITASLVNEAGTSVFSKVQSIPASDDWSKYIAYTFTTDELPVGDYVLTFAFENTAHSGNVANLKAVQVADATTSLSPFTILNNTGATNLSTNATVNKEKDNGWGVCEGDACFETKNSNIGYIKNGSTVTYQLVNKEAHWFVPSFNVQSYSNGGDVTLSISVDGSEVYNKTKTPTPTTGVITYPAVKLPVSSNIVVVFSFSANHTGYIINVNQINFTVKDSESYTIPSSGIGTFCSDCALDFSGIGATPYIITNGTITNNQITATSVDGVLPANTGIIVKGTAGAKIDIPVSTSETTADVTGNKLVGVTEATEVIYNNSNSYYVMNGGVLKKVTETGTIAANRAYLFLEGGGASAKSLELSFDGETTGIETVQGSEFTVNDANSPAYNLSGQRISKGYKGIVVKNGKKFMMK